MSKNDDGILVRQATRADAEAIVALELKVWTPLGTDVYGMDHVEAWLETHPEGLTVAEKDGTVVGYQYSQITWFSFEDYLRFGDFNEATDHGYTRKTHDPEGNAVHCISLLSAARGSGKLLLQGVLDAGDATGRTYTVFLSRMSGFGRFVEATPGDRMSYVGHDIRTIADWYALRCCNRLGSEPWPTMRDVPEISLPEPGEDPVLSKQLRFPRMRLVATLPDCMKDPQSKGFAALLIGLNVPKG